VVTLLTGSEKVRVVQNGIQIISWRQIVVCSYRNDAWRKYQRIKWDLR